MKKLHILTLLPLALSGCGRQDPPPPGKPPPGGQPATSLTEARRGFQTTLARKEKANHPVEQPPPHIFRIVHFDSPAGKLAAYLTPDPRDGKKHPAIIWITGGDCNTIGDVWTEAPPKNDQTAAAYRKAGIAMMFPSLRGGNDNPGFCEGFFGEVDDVLAAADFLAKQDFIDPQRIYLGGHSTGGTLALLVAACADNRFRAVFSFGPTDDVGGYDAEFIPFNVADRRELELRAPIRWLHSIKSPVFVLEGGRRGNVPALQAMARASTNAKLRFLLVNGADHFSILAPVNNLLAAKILRDDGPECNLELTEAEVNKLFR